MHAWAAYDYTLVSLQEKFQLPNMSYCILKFILTHVPEKALYYDCYGGMGTLDPRENRKHLFGEAFRRWWEKNPDKRDEIDLIYYELIDTLERNAYLPSIVGHPSFHDEYGVDIVATPRDIWLDDRFSYGKTVQ